MPGRWTGPVGSQDEILIGWVLSCPASTIVMPKQCSGRGLFCLARHLGRASPSDGLVVVSSHLLLASTGPSRAVGLSGAGGKGHAGMGDPYPWAGENPSPYSGASLQLRPSQHCWSLAKPCWS